MVPCIRWVGGGGGGGGGEGTKYNLTAGYQKPGYLFEVFFTDVCLKKYVLIPSLLSSARARGGDWGGGGRGGEGLHQQQEEVLRC